MSNPNPDTVDGSGTESIVLPDGTVIGGSLHQVLSDAVQAAELSAFVEPKPGCVLPALVLLGPNGMPPGYREDPTQWLTDQGIEADLLLPDEDGDRLSTVIVPRTAQAVASLASVLRQTQSRVREVVRAVRAAFAAKDVDGYVAIVNAEMIRVTFKDWDDLLGPVAICRLLGADDIADDLRLDRRGHKRKLLRRLRLLLVGALGPGIGMAFGEGCAHEPDTVEITLGLPQALTLADRLSRASPLTDAPTPQPDEDGVEGEEDARQ